MGRTQQGPVHLLLCTSAPEDEVPLRFRPWDAAPAPAVTEDGSVTVTMREVRDS